MSAGTIPPPLIITSEIAKKKSIPWNCLFELEAKDPSYFIYYTINAERPATFDLPAVYKKMNPKQRGFRGSNMYRNHVGKLVQNACDRCIL